MVTYFAAGLLAFTLLDYKTAFQSEHFACWMRPTTSKWVALGPGLQWIRGLIFALVLYPFRREFLSGDHGWLKLWALLLGLGVLSTYGPAPGSVEGLLYTTIPPWSRCEDSEKSSGSRSPSRSSSWPGIAARTRPGAGPSTRWRVSSW
jgi:hypothetical protein